MAYTLVRRHASSSVSPRPANAGQEGPGVPMRRGPPHFMGDEMPKKVPCSRCGALRSRGPGSLPEERLVCRSCRRREPQPYGPRPVHQPVQLALTLVRERPCLQRGTTSERGYGAPHQQLRKALLSEWHPGDPCARCGGPMLADELLDLDHADDRGGYLGLSHASCNRSANGLRWLRSTRVCESCRGPFTPRRRAQRFCARLCARRARAHAAAV